MLSHLEVFITHHNNLRVGRDYYRPDEGLKQSNRYFSSLADETGTFIIHEENKKYDCSTTIQNGFGKYLHTIFSKLYIFQKKGKTVGEKKTEKKTKSKNPSTDFTKMNEVIKKYENMEVATFAIDAWSQFAKDENLELNVLTWQISFFCIL
jgi:hypothetical protein